MSSAGGSNNQTRDAFNPESKKKAFEVLSQILLSIRDVGKISHFDHSDVDLSNKLEGAISTVYNALRKKANGNLKDPVTVRARKAIITAAVEVNIGEVMDNVESKIPIDHVDWKVTTPIVNMHTLNKLVKDESRVGVTQVMPKKSKDKKPVSITSYGLKPMHAPLLKYVTLKPERRSGMMRCMGPLTLCINLLDDKQFPDKAKAALKEAIKHLPMCDAIVECVSVNTKSTIGGLLGALGDVLLITTDRSHNKYTPPLLSVIKHYTTTNPDGDEYIDTNAYSTTFDFSGKGCTMFHRDAITGKKFKWTSNENATALNSEVFFHSCYSTHLEDLSVLNQVTTHQGFHQRKETGEVYKKDKKIVQEFNAIGLKYSSKLSNACGTKMLGTVEPMLQCKPIFSAKRKRTFSEELKRALSSNRTGAYNTDVASLTKALNDLKSDLLKVDLPRDFGTTEWHDVKDVTSDDWGPDVSLDVEEHMLYYFA